MEFERGRLLGAPLICGFVGDLIKDWQVQLDATHAIRQARHP